MCFSQTVTSNLKGKRIYLHRHDGGDHTDGYIGLQTMLQAKQAAYGYILESSTGSPGEADMNTLFDRLYKNDGKPKAANTIDIMIFCQGQGDQNVGGGVSVNPFAGSADRFTKVNVHVKMGGGLMMVHAAAGREVSWQNWFFGAKLMTDWFVDNYNASSLISGNGGHFSYGTQGTYTLDDETQPTKDSSASFIRNIFLLPKAQNGYGQPLISPDLKGEWYHFNGGKKYEDGTGGDATHPNNKIQPMQVRGNPGVPDSGIGPAKIIGGLTKISGNYTPPGGKPRPGIWAREVSKGAFSTGNSKDNGRFLYFNPGHAGEEYTASNGWMGDLFLASLRWVAKDDRGCTLKTAQNYNPLATVSEGCITTGIGRDALLQDKTSASFGKISLVNSTIQIAVSVAGPHSVKVTKINGEVVFAKAGNGVQGYQVPGLEHGIYMVQVNLQGPSFKKTVSIL